MMDFKNDYINLVVLGSFNPAILTHEFLVRECGFDLLGEPDSKGPAMPVVVVVSLEYGNISFSADLGRLQIMEKNCADPKGSKIPEYLQVYLDKLPYTPITKCGANFSYRLAAEKSRLGQITQWLRNDRDKFCKALKLNTITIEVVFAVDQSKEEVVNWILRTKADSYDASTMLKIAMPISGNEVKIDFNYEVATLDKDRQRLSSVTANYGEVFDLFESQLERIFTG
jgi:hypothetical protein